MGMFGGAKKGVYGVMSKSDPRFNNTWEDVYVMVSGGMPDFVDKWIKEKIKELGVKDYPEDLEFYGYKY